MNQKTRYRILVVDDDARLRELLSRYLQEQGFAVKAVGDAPMMDRALHREHYDLIVPDLMLPGGGLTVREAARRLPVGDRRSVRRRGALP
ncbi:MAG: response regulator [Thauera sp.]|nr:response regulator [Thauera sp.]